MGWTKWNPFNANSKLSAMIYQVSESLQVKWVGLWVGYTNLDKNFLQPGVAERMYDASRRMWGWVGEEDEGKDFVSIWMKWDLDGFSR